MNFSLKNNELVALNGGESPVFPKYTSQLMNWANQNAQGTRPRVVGQMSELFPAYKNETEAVSMDSWREWYYAKKPASLDEAADKIYEQVQNLQNAITLIDRDMVRRWVEDLVIDKTYNGLYVQEAILLKMAQLQNTTYRMATPAEESRGIDGYVGNTAYSVKPDSYKTMNRLSETIHVKMIYYTKKKDGLSIEVED